MTTKRQIVEDLRRRHALRTPAAAGDFWSRFEREAGGIEQDAPASRAPVWAWRAVPATALAAALVAIAGVMYFRPPARGPSMPMLSLDVRASYDSVIVMQDDADRGTIVWVTGVGGGEPDEG